eukprot:6173464-Pleurochrysis_carterae.AAC.1
MESQERGHVVTVQTQLVVKLHDIRSSVHHAWRSRDSQRARRLCESRGDRLWPVKPCWHA